jgi:hypothetical protein
MLSTPTTVTIGVIVRVTRRVIDRGSRAVRRDAHRQLQE